MKILKKNIIYIWYYNFIYYFELTNKLNLLFKCDFYIKSENKIIEVKSLWTLTIERGNVEEKAQATVKAGYKYEIWVYNGKKIKVETKVY